MKETIKRKRYLDVYRGIAMILVVLGHSVGTIQDPINWYIISFHMPVFFFISGICFNLSSNKGSISDGIIHKITTLGYQYFVFSLLGLTFYWLIRSRLGNDLNISLFSSFAGLLVGYNIVPGFWFVFDLFVISVLFIMTQNIPNKGFIWVLTSFLFFVVCSYYRDSFIYNEIIHRIMGGAFSMVSVSCLVFMIKESMNISYRKTGCCQLQ